MEGVGGRERAATVLFIRTGERKEETMRPDLSSVQRVRREEKTGEEKKGEKERRVTLIKSLGRDMTKISKQLH